MDPEFKVGDVVSYELSPYGCPRWNMDIDFGSSGKFFTAVIEEVGYNQIKCSIPEYKSFEHANRHYFPASEWMWPLQGHHRYSSTQWSRPGYLKPGSAVSVTFRPTYTTFNSLDRFTDLEIE